MCDIVGHVGGRDAVPVILDGLKRLEYRGYHLEPKTRLIEEGRALVTQTDTEVLAHLVESPTSWSRPWLRSARSRSSAEPTPRGAID